MYVYISIIRLFGQYIWYSSILLRLELIRSYPRYITRLLWLIYYPHLHYKSNNKFRFIVLEHIPFASFPLCHQTPPKRLYLYLTYNITCRKRSGEITTNEIQHLRHSICFILLKYALPDSLHRQSPPPLNHLGLIVVLQRGQHVQLLSHIQPPLAPRVL